MLWQYAHQRNAKHNNDNIPGPRDLSHVSGVDPMKMQKLKALFNFLVTKKRKKDVDEPSLFGRTCSSKSSCAYSLASSCWRCLTDAARDCRLTSRFFARQAAHFLSSHKTEQRRCDNYGMKYEMAAEQRHRPEDNFPYR